MSAVNAAASRPASSWTGSRSRSASHSSVCEWRESLAGGLKYKLGYDDSLDVIGVHLVGGIIGCLYLGFFSTDEINPAATNGLFFGGGGTLLGKQAVAALSVFAYSFTVAFILGWIITKTIGFRISSDAEVEGIDLNEHSETAYEFATQSGTGAISSGQLTGAHRHQAKDEGDLG